MSKKKPAPEIRFEAKKIYLKDVSFESPISPGVFARGIVKPNIDVQLSLRHSKIENDFHEVVLQATVSSKLKDEVLFLVEVHQAGIFEIICEDSDKLEIIKEVACATMLLPFVRETIADLVAKGGFPQLLLNPINFEALYMNKTKKMESSKNTPTSDAIN